MAAPEPPKPLAHDVRLVRPDGTPTAEFHQYLMRLYDWQRRMRTDLDAKEPAIATGDPALFWAGDKTWKAP